MRVTFRRWPDHVFGHAVIERDDGVVYHLRGGPAGSHVPHDLVHFVVEDQLRMADGIWGAIAGGVVFRSMLHVDGRRPPHAADRSDALKREHRASVQAAELIGGYVERLADDGVDSIDEVARAARTQLSTLHVASVDPAALLRAAQALRDTASRWAALE